MSENHLHSRESIRISVVVPFYNNRATVRFCARSILACDPPADEVIFIDDGSVDGSAEELTDLPVSLICIRHGGRAAALNAGISHATGDLILFTDADCLVPVQWVQQYRDGLAGGEVDGIGGNLWPSRFSTVETAKVLRYVHEFLQDIIIEGHYANVCLNGNNMAVRKKCLDRIGGFDETYRHGADADLTRRLIDSGSKLLRTRAITTTHLKVDSMATFLRTSFHRGSTIRFHRPDGSAGPSSLFRTVVSAGGNLIRDLGSISRLDVFGLSGTARLKGIPAAGLNLMASFWNWAGQRHYTGLFRKGGIS